MKAHQLILLTVGLLVGDLVGLTVVGASVVGVSYIV